MIGRQIGEYRLVDKLEKRCSVPSFDVMTVILMGRFRLEIKSIYGVVFVTPQFTLG